VMSRVSSLTQEPWSGKEIVWFEAYW